MSRSTPVLCRVISYTQTFFFTFFPFFSLLPHSSFHFSLFPSFCFFPCLGGYCVFSFHFGGEMTADSVWIWNSFTGKELNSPSLVCVCRNVKSFLEAFESERVRKEPRWVIPDETLDPTRYKQLDYHTHRPASLSPALSLSQTHNYGVTEWNTAEVFSP